MAKRRKRGESLSSFNSKFKSKPTRSMQRGGRTTTRQQSQEGHCRKGYIWNGTECVPVFPDPWNTSDYYDEDGFCLPLLDLPWVEGEPGNQIWPCQTDSNPECDECFGVGPYIELAFSNSTICVSQSGECVVNRTGDAQNHPAQNYLLLGGKDLGGLIPDNIGQLNYLEALGLDNNQLTGKIPKTLGALPNLHIVTLNNNFLEGEIPEQVCNWQGNFYFPGFCTDDYCNGWEELLMGYAMYDFTNNRLCPPWPSCIEYSPVGNDLIAGQDISYCPELEEGDCYRCDSSSSQEACAEWGGSYGCHYCVPGDDNYYCNKNNTNQCICMSTTYGCCYTPSVYQTDPSRTDDIFQYLEQHLNTPRPPSKFKPTRRMQRGRRTRKRRR